MSAQQISATAPGKNDEGWSTAKVVGAVLSAIGGVVAVVYLFGGLVLLLRLQLKGLRAEVVVATLPREFLVSIGLAVLLQLVVMTGVLLLGIPLAVPLARAERHRQVPWRVWIRPWRWMRVRRRDRWKWAAALVAPVLATLVLAFPLARWIGWQRAPWLVIDFVAGVITAVVLTLALFSALRFAPAIVGRLRLRLARAGLVASATTLCVAAFLVFLPWRIALEWFSLEGLNVQVCTKSELNGASGILIGENDSALYIGESDPPGTQSPRVAEVPRSDIERVFLGKSAIGTHCNKRQPPSTSK